MGKKVVAKLIEETSGGSLAVEIYENDHLVWSHDYLQNGATKNEIERIRKQIISDMLRCEKWRDFEGCDLDENGNVLSQKSVKSIITLNYKKGCWKYKNVLPLTNNLILTNQDRLPVEIYEKAVLMFDVLDGYENFVKTLK